MANADGGQLRVLHHQFHGQFRQHFQHRGQRTIGVDELIVNSNDQADVLTLNASGSGGGRTGNDHGFDRASRHETLTFTGIDALVVNTFAPMTPLWSAIRRRRRWWIWAGDDSITVGFVPLVPDAGNTNVEYPGGLLVGNSAGITNGNSNALVLFGGANNDTFNIVHNVAALYVDAGAGNDFINLATVIVLRPTPGSSGFTQPTGAGGNRYDYLDNGAMVFTGGAGVDRLTLVGTPGGVMC